MKIALLISLAFYIVFDFIDKKNGNDEREQLIRIKALGFSHYATMIVLCLISLSLFFNYAISTTVLIMVIVFSSLYTEIIGKVYYRWKL